MKRVNPYKLSWGTPSGLARFIYRYDGVSCIFIEQDSSTYEFGDVDISGYPLLYIHHARQDHSLYVRGNLGVPNFIRSWLSLEYASN